MNASTFTARVVASTQADLFCAVTGAYCALTGPLHGGAPEPVLEMLDAIGNREKIKPWIDAALARKERLMGFGHRVYRVRDPRADVLKSAIERLGLGVAELPFAGEVEAYAREALRKKESGAAAGHECRVLHRHPARHATNPAPGLHTGLRCGPRRRLDRTCARAAAHGTTDPARLGVYREGAGLEHPATELNRT
jgi:Citrate synthase, C-terminal domain